MTVAPDSHTSAFSSKFPRTFSRCSRADLEMFLEKPQTGCLANAPDPDRLVGGPVCGNLFVERGEQCDCGTPQVCPAPSPCLLLSIRDVASVLVQR